MAAPETEAFATRLHADEAQLLKEAVRETNQTKAEILRRAARWYIHHNPEGIAALYPEGSVEAMMEEL